MSNVLEKEDVDLFYKLYSRLLCFVNKQAKILQSKMLSPNEFETLSLKDRAKIREVLYTQKEYIDQFLKSKNVQKLNNDELAIIESWKSFEKGNFFIYKHYKKHSIFLKESEKAFAVCGISDPLNEMFPTPPVYIETVLIPFKNHIIYDGLINGYSIHFGSGFRNSLKDSYEKAKRNEGLILQLSVNKEKDSH